jgi:hypothetical protein
MNGLEIDASALQQVVDFVRPGAVSVSLEFDRPRRAGRTNGLSTVKDQLRLSQ